MAENKLKKNNRPIVSVEEIDSGTLEDNNAYTLTKGILPLLNTIQILYNIESAGK